MDLLRQALSKENGAAQRFMEEISALSIHLERERTSSKQLYALNGVFARGNVSREDEFIELREKLSSVLRWGEHCPQILSHLPKR